MAFSGGLSNIKDIFNRPDAGVKPKNPSNVSKGVAAEGDIFLDNYYALNDSNWYTAKPYGFRLQTRNSDTPITMFLPISPNNLTINTHFATNLIPTLYGTVEEHSDVRYFDIVIEGTTGIAPRFVQPFSGETEDAYSEKILSGRASFSIASSISAFGLFPKTVAAINQIKQKATDLISGAPKPEKGLIDENSGYVAFHNLYRILLKYKKDASGVSSNAPRKAGWHPITFFNYKDNNEYDVVIRSFTMRRSAENPMLYQYSIQMTAYNLRTVSSNLGNDADLSQRYSDLGLDGVDGSSVLGDMKSLANRAKSVVASTAGAVPNIGR
jgi:hypothetical protein